MTGGPTGRLRALIWIVLVVCASIVPAGAAFADDDPFAPLAERDANLAVLRHELTTLGPKLAKGKYATTEGEFTLCVRGSDAVRTRRAKAWAVFLADMRARLAEAGLAVKGMVPITVIEARVAPGQDGMVTSEDRKFVLLRRAPVSRDDRGGLPRLPERADGELQVKDIVKTADRLRIALWTTASRVSSGGGALSLGDVLADRMLQQTELPEKTPSWAYLGLRSWLGAGAPQGPDDGEDHVCATAVPENGDIDPRTLVPDSMAAIVGVVARKSNGRIAAVLARYAASEGDDAARFAAAFGATPRELLAKAAAADAATEGESETEGAQPVAECLNGRLPCPLCAGTSEVTVACPDCVGLKSLTCPSCGGGSVCPSPCIGGKRRLLGYDVKCAYCKGKGEVRCKACRGQGRNRCRTCKIGRLNWPCPLCTDGTVPCPERGVSDELLSMTGQTPGDCRWCAQDLVTACPDCGGAAYQGCPPCDGTAFDRCEDCFGLGSWITKRYSGWGSPWDECRTCDGDGGKKCTHCRSGKRECGTCKRKGVVPRPSSECDACDDEGHTINVKRLAERVDALTRPPTEEEAAATRAMLDRAIAFLLTCRSGTGPFALREQRENRAANGDKAGRLYDSNLFANSISLWALASVGIDKDDARVKEAFGVLRAQARELLTESKVPTTQSVALALRALSVGGEPVDGPLISSLVDKLVEGQQRNGLWADDLAPDLEGDAFSGLFALESLWIAKRRGAKISRVVFQKALRGAKRGFTPKGIKGMKRGWVSGTNVASRTALVVIAKAGSLGDKASTYDFESMREVRTGLAWLDRHFDIRQEPIFSNGARRAGRSDGGYMAYLFSIQRLAMLLDIPILAGERWHTTGARHLVSIQFDDGSFEERRFGLNGPVRSTANVIMFLARATVPITRKSK